MAVLMVQRKSRPAQVYQLRSKQTLVGRGKDVDLLLPDISVSRHHARVERRSHEDRGVDEWFLMDLGSQNGTKVNGEVIAEHKLSDEDEIQMGKFILSFAEKRPDEGAGLSMDSYKVSGREGFLAEITQMDGENAHSTTHLSKEALKEARRIVFVRDNAQIRRRWTDEEGTVLGSKGVVFGKGGIAVGGMGLGGVVRLSWQANRHVVRKEAGLMVTLKVNGKAVKEQGLEAGDLLVIGKAEYEYVVD
jgi:hypothetical protein